MNESIKKAFEEHALWLSSNGAQGAQARLDHADLSQMVLDGVDLRYARLRGTRFVRASLVGCRLGRADLRQADLSYADCRDADFEGAGLFSASLEGAVMRGANLRSAQLHEAVLNYADLRQADLTGAHLQRSQLAFADLSGSLLEDAQVEACVLDDATMTGARVRGARFAGGSLRRAALQGVPLDLAVFDNVTADPGVLGAQEAPKDAETVEMALDPTVPYRRAMKSGRQLEGKLGRLSKVAGWLAVGSLAIWSALAVADLAMIFQIGQWRSSMEIDYRWMMAAAIVFGVLYAVALHWRFRTGQRVGDVFDQMNAAVPAEPTAEPEPQAPSAEARA